MDFLNFLWNCVCCRKTHWKFSVAQASTFKHTDSKISMLPTLAAEAYFNQSQYILLHWSFEWVEWEIFSSRQLWIKMSKWANVGLKNLLLKSYVFVYMDMLGDKCSLCVNVSFQMSFVFHRLFLWTSQLSCRSRSCLNLRSFIRSEPLFFVLQEYLYVYHFFQCIPHHATSTFFSTVVISGSRLFEFKPLTKLIWSQTASGIKM